MNEYGIKLNLGCGSTRPEGWINTDSSLNAQLQKTGTLGRFITKNFFKSVSYTTHNVRYMNLNKNWKFKDNSIDVVYASHLFEHLSLFAADIFLREAFRCLKPDAPIRIVVPDLFKISKKYVNDFEIGEIKAAEYMMWAINMHREGQYGLKIGVLKRLMLELNGYPHQHKYMYDERSLGKKMSEFGFEDIFSLKYGISNYIPQIKEVEGVEESYLSIYLEAVKKTNK